jgi:V8-like Glu-specific endopeptidase
MLVTRYLSDLMDASARRFVKVGARRPGTPGEPRRRGEEYTLKQRYEQILAEVRDPEEARATLERIINGNDLTDVAYLVRGTLCARSVGRVVVRSDDDRILMYGTGFLVAPGVLMTNHHVINDAVLTRRSIVNFDFERDVRGVDRTPVDFAMIDEADTIAVPDLDFALVRLAPVDVTGNTPVTAYRWIKLSATIGKTLENEYLTIIQHPAAQQKQVCVRENRLLEYGEDTLWYQTDTLGGRRGHRSSTNLGRRSRCTTAASRNATAAAATSSSTAPGGTPTRTRRWTRPGSSGRRTRGSASARSCAG